MGCDEIRTLDPDFDQENDGDYAKSQSICSKIYSGSLQIDIVFEDTLIKSQDELDDKLRCYIPTKIKKPDSDDLAFNTKDDILTKSANINFNNNYIIALNGINKVVRVEEMEGNYVIYHDNKSGYRNRYVALVVRKIGPNPKFILATPKRDYLNE